jgi:hypothetical protein
MRGSRIADEHVDYGPGLCRRTSLRGCSRTSPAPPRAQPRRRRRSRRSPGWRDPSRLLPTRRSCYSGRLASSCLCRRSPAGSLRCHARVCLLARSTSRLIAEHAGRLDWYNRLRPHRSLGRRPPLTRLAEMNNLVGTNTQHAYAPSAALHPRRPTSRPGTRPRSPTNRSSNRS